MRSDRRLKLVLALMLVVGVVGSFTVGGVYGLLSSTVGNTGAGIASGTMTLNNTNAGDAASTTLTQNVGTTTLASSVGQTTLAAGIGQTTLSSAVPETTLSADVGTTTLSQNVGTTTLSGGVGTTTLTAALNTNNCNATTIAVNAITNFPAVTFQIQIGSEQMTVNTESGAGNKTWHVTRCVNSTSSSTHPNGSTVNQVNKVNVTSDAGFPGSGNYTILIGTEQMTVTGGQGTTSWTVTRAVNSTTAATHASGAALNQITMTVSSAAHFPASGNYTIQIDSEQMTVTAGQGTTTWTVTRAVNATTAVSHTSGATVNALTVSVASATGFPGAGNYTILIGSEQMTVTGGQGTTTWTVTRAVNSTTAATHSSGANVDTTTIGVTSASGFPNSGNYTIQIGSEQMTVTGGQGTTTWTVTRGANGTTVAGHSNGATVDQITISVASATGFPGSGNYTILIDNEQMTVTAGQGTTTWTVSRGVNSTTAVAHALGAAVTPLTINVTSAAGFPSSGNYSIQIDNEQLTVTGGQGTTAWNVTRAVNGTSMANHSNGATVNQTTMTGASASGFPSTSVYTVLVDSEKMQVTAGQGTTTWTLVRGVDGTSIANHASGAAVATSDCRSIDGTGNVNTGCDSLFTSSPAGEAYPGVPAVSKVTIKDSGSIASNDMLVYMPSCLRGITSDAPFASSVPGTPSFSGAATTGGHLSGLITYYYEVTAVTGSGESIPGGEASYTPPFGTNTNQITLTWSPVAGATYKVYRSDSAGNGEGGELLLASGVGINSYTDSTATTPSGSPPSGTGSGNPCVTGTTQLYIQETNSSGTATECWYPVEAPGTCAFDGTYDLGLFAQYLNSSGTAIDLGTGPGAMGSRYFKIGVQLPNASANALQGTSADFTLMWYAQS